ncbi:hypothetical protein Ahy_A06g029685 [Arachis hypogaea]|uniref:PB1-like domain-containing protein n=1 Tax=Arachis hypogaea TaxID=3818 RepID=A0A445CU40_ARAHY|nr:hypothetical protein Ahy_A06g029685 [Arachis hypogaea]
MTKLTLSETPYLTKTLLTRESEEFVGGRLCFSSSVVALYSFLGFGNSFGVCNGGMMMMATHITFVYHHRGWLEKDADGVLEYNGGLVSIIERVHVDTCNLFLVEGLFLDLGYTRYNEVYWLEPGMDLANGLRVLGRDVDVVKMCDAAQRNKNRVHLYFEHPVDADPESANHDQEPQQNEEEEGSEHTEVEGAPLLNEGNEQEDPPQHEEQLQEEDEPTLNKRGYDEALPEEAATENLSNQTQANN